MSESPGPGGDAESITDAKRPAEGDDGVDVIPTKFVKVNEKVDDNPEDEDAALDDEEQDFDDGEDDEEPDEDLDFGDEDDMDDGELDFNAPNEEAIFDETGESSTDLDEFIQANLAYIDDCQSDIDTLNQKANDEILKVEQKYNKLRQPVYTRRNKYIERIPNFWATVFSRHPQLKRVLTKDDVKCLKFLINLQIDDFEDSRSGYSIKFKFAPNLWFNNTSITKEYHLPWHDSPSCECTPIEWKQGMNLTLKTSSFFSWFCSQEDASTDDIAEIIKEELWPNPLQSYLMKENGDADSTDDSEDEDDGPVYIDDDEDVAEYVSSDDEGSDVEEWKRPAALGKEAPSTSKNELYVIDDDDDELENEAGIEYEDGIDEDADLSSQGNYGYDDDTDASKNIEKDDDIIPDDDDVIADDGTAKVNDVKNNMSDNGQTVTSSNYMTSSKDGIITSQSTEQTTKSSQSKLTNIELNNNTGVMSTRDAET